VNLEGRFLCVSHEGTYVEQGLFLLVRGGLRPLPAPPAWLAHSRARIIPCEKIKYYTRYIILSLQKTVHDSIYDRFNKTAKTIPLLVSYLDLFWLAGENPNIRCS
jgi:hypothetical protein